MSGAEGGSEAPPEDLRKENLRLGRRVARLEVVLEQLEEIRDVNARLQDRLRRDLEHERERSHALLLNLLPDRIVRRLEAGEAHIADRHDDVAVVFGDLVGFTRIAGDMPVAELVEGLGALFAAFDAHCEALGVEKIKTIGDAYMACAGLEQAAGGGAAASAAHVVAAGDLALAMREAVRAAGPPWQVRLGIHRGPAVAGVIGARKFFYDVWGDTVNVASRLESTAEPDTIHVSEGVAEGLRPAFHLEARGPVDLKGKGSTDTWLLVGRA